MKNKNLKLKKLIGLLATFHAQEFNTLKYLTAFPLHSWLPCLWVLQHYESLCFFFFNVLRYGGVKDAWSLLSVSFPMCLWVERMEKLGFFEDKVLSLSLSLSRSYLWAHLIQALQYGWSLVLQRTRWRNSASPYKVWLQSGEVMEFLPSNIFNLLKGNYQSCENQYWLLLFV